MLDETDCKSLRKDLEELSEGKLQVMTQGRRIVKTSKALIYSLHRNDLKAAGKHMLAIEGQRQKLERIADTESLRGYGPYPNALQEYVEAVGYYFFVIEKRIPGASELSVCAQTYLMGLSDLTGELMRRAVNGMAAGDPKIALNIRDVVDEIHGLMLSLDFDGGEARRKSDQVKWNLAKIEGLIAEARIRDKI